MGCAASSSQTTLDLGSNVENGVMNHADFPIGDDPALLEADDTALMPAVIEQQMLCGTDLSLGWLVRVVNEACGEDAEEPQWIAEKLNAESCNDKKGTEVIRVSFAWDENSQLPRMVVLKVPAKITEEFGELARNGPALHHRECCVYEWLQMEEKILVPHIYHVREATDEVMGVIVMEDLTEKGHKSPVIANVELIKEVVKALACLHSASLRNRTFTTVPPLPSRHFERLSANYRAVVALFVEHNIDTTLLRSSRELFTAESMISTVEGAAEKLGCETVLVHGMVTRENIFVVNKDDQRVLALIDWKEAHEGSLGEDLAMAVCSNLSPDDRLLHLARLLDYYHFHLHRYGCPAPITIDLIKRAYNFFLPFATAQILLRLPDSRIERQQLQTMLERGSALLVDAVEQQAQAMQAVQALPDETQTVQQPPETEAVQQPPETEAVQQPPETEAVQQPEEIETVQQLEQDERVQPAEETQENEASCDNPVNEKVSNEE